MSSLGDLADLLAIGAQAQQGSQAINSNIDLGSLGLGGDDNGINIPGLSLPTVQGGSAATSTQASRTAQTSATQVSNTSSTGSSQSISSSSTSTSSISATTTSSSGSPSSSAASTLETSSATDSASASSPTGSSTTDTPSAGIIATQSSDTPAPDATSTGTVTASLTSGVSDSLGPTPTGNAKAADTVPTGFLAHKPLYIGIIVVASILGIIFFVVVGTWALRRRRRGKIADFAEELSSDNLVGASSGFGGGSSGSSLGHGSDVEKGVTVAGGWGVDVIEKMEAVGGSRGEGAPLGAMARGPSQTQRNVHPAAYGQPDYMNPYGQSPYSQIPGRTPSRSSPPMQNAVYQQQPMVGQFYPQPPPTYASPYAQTQPQRQKQHISPVYTSPTESFTYGSQLPNPFEGADPHVLASQPAHYDLAHTPVPVQQFSVSPPRNGAPIQRKPPPPFLTLDTAMSPVAPGPTSAGSLSGPPMQPVSSINSANPPMNNVESPQDLAATSRAALSGKKATSAGVIHPDIEFGSPTVVNGGSPVTANSPRLLKVVNA